MGVSINTTRNPPGTDRQATPALSPRRAPLGPRGVPRGPLPRWPRRSPSSRCSAGGERRCCGSCGGWRATRCRGRLRRGSSSGALVRRAPGFPPRQALVVSGGVVLYRESMMGTAHNRRQVRSTGIGPALAIGLGLVGVVRATAGVCPPVAPPVLRVACNAWALGPQSGQDRCPLCAAAARPCPIHLLGFADWYGMACRLPRALGASDDDCA